MSVDREIDAATRRSMPLVETLAAAFLRGEAKVGDRGVDADGVGYTVTAIRRTRDGVTFDVRADPIVPTVIDLTVTIVRDDER